MGGLIRLALSVLSGLGARQVISRAAGPVALGAGGALVGSELGGGGPFPGFFGIGGGGGGGALPRRRRRRKALTNTDMQTALTIASAISKKAAENFILVRARGS